MKAEVLVYGTTSGVNVAVLYDETGSCEVADFLQELKRQSPKDYKRIQALFNYASQSWPIVNREKCKQVEGPVWEFKAHQIRILWFINPDVSGRQTVMCVSAERKKRDDLSPGTISRARNRYQEWGNHLKLGQTTRKQQ